MKKSKGMQLGTLLAVMLLLSMAFVPAVSAVPSDSSNKLTVQKEQVAEALATLESAQTDAEIGILSTASVIKDAVDALRVIVATLIYYDDDPRLVQASSELVTASNLLAQGNIEEAVPHILNALNYLWDYLDDNGSQLLGWLYDALIAALIYLYNLIVQYL